MKELIRKQEKELDKELDKALDIVSLKDENANILLDKNTIVKIKYKAIAKKYIKQAIAKVRKETVEYERERILKALPQGYKDLSSQDFDKSAREYEIRYSEMFGYNRCLVDVKDKLKEL